MYGYAFSMFLVAVGAILRFAVTADAEGFDTGSAGIILMVIGIIGLMFTFGFRLMDHDEYTSEERMGRRYRRFW